MPNLEEAERRLMDAQKKLLGLMALHQHPDDFLISFQSCPQCWRGSRSLYAWEHRVRALRREASEPRRYAVTEAHAAR